MPILEILLTNLICLLLAPLLKRYAGRHLIWDWLYLYLFVFLLLVMVVAPWITVRMESLYAPGLPHP